MIVFQIDDNGCVDFLSDSCGSILHLMPYLDWICLVKLCTIKISKDTVSLKNGSKSEFIFPIHRDFRIFEKTTRMIRPQLV